MSTDEGEIAAGLKEEVGEISPMVAQSVEIVGTCWCRQSGEYHLEPQGLRFLACIREEQRCAELVNSEAADDLLGLPGYHEIGKGLTPLGIDLGPLGRIELYDMVDVEQLKDCGWILLNSFMT